MFAPTFVISPSTASALMEIEATRQAVIELPINVEVLASLRETARLAATHYSTQIEGNRLTQAQVEEVLAGAHFPGRERDEVEVRNYYRALEHVERLATEAGSLTEDRLKRIHGLVMKEKASPSAYRDGQNVIRDSATGGIVYLPPEAPTSPASWPLSWNGSMWSWSAASCRHQSWQQSPTISTPRSTPTTTVTGGPCGC